MGRLQTRPHPLGRLTLHDRQICARHLRPRAGQLGAHYLPDDYSQANDIAAQHPQKLAELKELFWQEAEKHNVLPLLAGFSVFFGMLPPMPTVTKQAF